MIALGIILLILILVCLPGGLELLSGIIWLTICLALIGGGLAILWVGLALVIA